MKTINRREFLKISSGSALALFLASCAPQLLANNTPTGPSKAGATPAAQDARLPPKEIVITNIASLYQQQYSSTPDVDERSWFLQIGGLVDTPLKVDMATIKSLPQHDEVRTLQCIGNPVGGNLIGNVEWNGVLIKDLLAKVKIDPKATHVNFQAADGYYTSVALDWVMQDGTLLAHGINGSPLPPGHGFPLRINMPGLYGQKMPKWITQIEFTDNPVTGYWESQGWSNTADVQTNSKVLQPHNGELLTTSKKLASGVAFAGKRQITKVEISIDGQTWINCELLHGAKPLVWTQWSTEWEAKPGRYQVSVRATDENGFTQNVDAGGYLDQSYPNGTSAIASVAVRVE
jgi:DMSO/TMAO reductase YedYZ molybdopterin-dependent catalytic subunit